MPSKKSKTEMVIIHDNCCGIDVGSKSHVVATGLSQSDVKEYGVYTQDLELLVFDLKALGIKHIAMESTGSYWQVLFSTLQLEGFDVRLVDGKQTKNYKKKTDYQDARAIYQLHRLGFLSACFLPDRFTNALRTLYRYRGVLREENTRCINRMQKCMRLMNFRIDNIINDVVGKSGQRLISSIISGNVDPAHLVSLIDSRVRKTEKELIKGCTGQIDEIQVFLLSDAFNAYHNNFERISHIDRKIKQLLENHLKHIPSKIGTKKNVGKNQINIGLQNLAYRYYGVDLFAIESVSYNVVMTLISEIGKGLDKFETSKEFCSWLRLAPNNRISGGKTLSSRTPKGKNPLAQALRNAANTISRSKKGYLQAFFKRIAFKKGRASAITATARKLATIIYSMIKYQNEYKPVDANMVSQRIKKKVIQNIKNKLSRLNIDPILIIKHV